MRYINKTCVVCAGGGFLGVVRVDEGRRGSILCPACGGDGCKPTPDDSMIMKTLDFSEVVRV